MCKICVDYQKGAMTAKEALNAFCEAPPSEEHMESFDKSLSDEQKADIDKAIKETILRW